MVVQKINQIISESGISFGTSGARGLVEDFTKDICAAFTQSFIHTLKQEFTFSSIAIAVDLRPSSIFIAQYCAASASKLGIEVKFFGVIPTPALANASMYLNIPSIMVTGSHIPFDRNGMKFYTPLGEISKLDEARITSNEELVKDITESDVVGLSVDNFASQFYIDRYLDFFDKELLKGKKIGVYEHSSAGRDIYPRIFEALGAEVVCLDRSDEFVPIDTEAVSQVDINRAQRWSQEYEFDLIFSTDGDGDRPLIADENGSWLKGDILGLISASLLRLEALAIPVSCNTSIESCGQFKKVARTKIGSPYVIDTLEEFRTIYGSYAGFEANGGFILASNVSLNNKVITSLPTRDAMLPVLAIMTQKATISDLVCKFTKRYTYSNRLQDVKKSLSYEILKLALNNTENFLALCSIQDVHVIRVDETDGVRLYLSNQDILHLRPSGNAPELRCYAESTSSESAESIVTNVLHYVSKIK
ncbi:phosphomannomutase [Vibrio nigripulchritudo]|uniref:phosphomannomutase n=1 Tax=Vibrio nigripulchritudo TaxID=28173 RepID=UPI0005F9ED2D|nr:phosphomannomutase [Vibrio nigripulchritudo]KJY79121.1 phosphomannomutase [Vibrio nigripulchritudo]